MQLFSLFARRNADPPTFRVTGALPSVLRRERLSNEYAQAASLEAEHTATLRNRPGDIPRDLMPDNVPIDERTPYPAAPSGPSDAEALAHLRALTDILHRQNPEPDSQLEHDLSVLDATLDQGSSDSVESIVNHLTNALTTLNADEHGIGNEEAAALEENLTALTDLGFRAPYDQLVDYYPPDDDEEENN